MKFDLEYTDTFGGDANYCWCERKTIDVKNGESKRAVMREAKAAMGLTGVRGETYDFGDEYKFVPRRCNTVMFVHWHDESLDAPVDPYPESDWQYEVTNGDTKLDYQTWRAHKAEADAALPA